MRDISTQEVVSQFIKFVNPLDMCTHNCLLFFKHSDITIYFSIAELIVLEVFQGHRDLVFSLMVEQYMESAGVIINFKLGSHGLFNSSQ
jgi:hypothetical protein